MQVRSGSPVEKQAVIDIDDFFEGWNVWGISREHLKIDGISCGTGPEQGIIF